jgi:hypothetical protein
MRIELTYFKNTGKYYTDSEYFSKTEDWIDIMDEIKNLVSRGQCPGLIDCAPGTNEFYVLVNIPDHKYNVPKLIIP